VSAEVARAQRRGTTLAEFDAVREREILNFDEVRLPAYRTIVVTGGTGCIGTAVLGLLRRRGVKRIISISRRPPRRNARVPHVDYRQADIRDAAAICKILEATRPDLVIHLAGQRQPDLAEREAGDTISSNVLGTASVLAASGRTGVTSVVTASTGKALRYFAPEVYAASKKLGEYLVSQAPGRWGISCSTVRFTHVVDNSLIYGRLRRWAGAGQPIRLHAQGIGFYAQSAREAAQLLTVAASARQSSPHVFALSDIGWPIDLFTLARDVIEDEASSSAISFSGYEPGYEDHLFPGTFDPLRTDGSPLFNALEARRATNATPGNSVESVPLQTDPDPSLDRAISALEDSWLDRADDRAMRDALREASTALLKRSFAVSAPSELADVCRLASGNIGQVPEHAFVYRHLLQAAELAGALTLAGSGAPSRSDRGDH
jgi:nucleoside-diphosphate-sugar epimerase